jgi:hypothetical protein
VIAHLPIEELRPLAKPRIVDLQVVFSLWFDNLVV